MLLSLTCRFRGLWLNMYNGRRTTILWGISRTLAVCYVWCDPSSKALFLAMNEIFVKDPSMSQDIFLIKHLSVLSGDQKQRIYITDCVRIQDKCLHPQIAADVRICCLESL